MKIEKTLVNEKNVAIGALLFEGSEEEFNRAMEKLENLMAKTENLITKTLPMEEATKKYGIYCDVGDYDDDIYIGSFYAKPSEAEQKYQEWLNNGFCKLNPCVLYVEEMTE